MANDMHRGAKIGTRVSMLVSQAVVATHKALLGTKHKLAMLVFRAISDEISEEVHVTLGPIYRALAEQCEVDSPLKPMLEFMATQHGQLQAVVGMSLNASGLLWSISQIMNNELAKLVYFTVSSNPHLIPDPATIAQLAAGGRIDNTNAVGGFAANGYDAGWANAVIDLQRSYPSVDQATDMFRRNLIDGPVWREYLTKNGIPESVLGAFAGLVDQPLSPADAALATLRGSLTQAQGEAIAKLSGVSTESFNTLIGNTGEPPGLMQLLEAFRRNFIDQATLQKGIKESRVRDEWIPVVEKLRYAPMSVSDAVNAFVQNHIQHPELSTIASDNGLEPGQVDILALTAGEPLSRTEASELVNRGLMTEDEFVQDLKESRLKDKYIAQAYALRRKLLEPRMLSSAVQTGATDQAYAIKVAMEYGYSQEDAQILVREGSLRKLQTYRDRVMSALESLVVDQIMSPEQAAPIAKALGFSTDETTFILEAVQFHAESRLVSQAVTAIRSKYVGHHIQHGDASNFLDALGIPSEQRDQLLKLWDIEASAATTVLTEAQIVKAFTLQLITQDDAMTRLQEKGYSATDANLLINGA